MAIASTAGRHLLHIFPTFAVGGVQNRIVRVINGLGRKFRHTVVAMDGNFAAAGQLHAGLELAFETVALRKTGFLSLSNLGLARGALRRLRPDLLLTYNWGTTEWALADRAPRICAHIHFESGFGPDESPRRQLWRRVVARYFFLSGCRHVVVPSNTLYEVATRIWRIPATRLLYIPNGVDCGRFVGPPDIAFLAALGIPDSVPVIGTVAALRPEKNLLRLIRVFAAVPCEVGAWLVIVGDGPEMGALKAAAASDGVSDRVVFAGHMSNPEEILGRFDVFALTSDTEQMPNAVLEAMAAGLAVAATDVGDTKRMLCADNARFVVPANDEGALTAAVLRLLQDRSLAKRIGRANRQRAQTELSFDTMVARYEELYSGD